MVNGLRNAALAVVLLTSGVAGFWFGGALERGVSLIAVGAAAVLVLVADLLGSPESRPARIAAAVAAGLVFAGGWYAAGREIGRAYGDCAARAESVRFELERFHRAHGRYPDALEDIGGIHIPGRRILRSGLLEYHRTDGGYILSFGDGFVTNTATRDRGFFE
jgi:hypothetical protein